MIIVVIENQEMGVGICGMSFGQFLCLCHIIEAYEHSRYRNARSLSYELHCSYHWIIHWEQRMISLVFMTWEQVCMLTAMLSDVKAVPEILEALDAAMEMGIS